MIPLFRLAHFKLLYPIAGQVKICSVGEQQVSSNSAPTPITRMGFKQFEFVTSLSFPVNDRVILQLSWPSNPGEVDEVNVKGFVTKKQLKSQGFYLYTLMLHPKERNNLKLFSFLLQKADWQAKIMKQVGHTYKFNSSPLSGLIKPQPSTPAATPAWIQSLGRPHWHNQWSEEVRVTTHAYFWPGGYLLFPSKTNNRSWGPW